MIDEETRALIQKVKHRANVSMQGLENVIYQIERSEQDEIGLDDLVDELDLCFGETDKYYQDISPKFEELIKKAEESEDDASGRD